MTIRLEWKKENGEVLVKIKGQPGTWGRPVIDSFNVVYRSLRVASEAVNTSQSSLRSAIETGALVKARNWRYATEEEVLKYGDGASDQLGTTEQVQQAPASTEKRTNNPLDPPFTGVKWPDGRVTVRLLTGGDWSMTTYAEELPDEIASSCTWLAVR